MSASSRRTAVPNARAPAGDAKARPAPALDAEALLHWERRGRSRPMYGPRMTVTIGLVLLSLGAFAFVAPNQAGVHFGAVHALAFVVAGTLAVHWGANRPATQASESAMLLGTVFAIAAYAGFVLGETSPGAGLDADLVRVIPGTLEFARGDHLLHLIVGALFLFAGGVAPEDEA